MQTRFELLNKIYLPGYTGILTADYHKRSGVFDFRPIEPKVTIFSERYFTPRGGHIFISQAGFLLLENLFETEEFDMTPQEYRDLSIQGKMKIIELNQKYRRELSVNENLQGRVDLTRVRFGRAPVVKLNFDIANRAITGDFTCIIAPTPVLPLNGNIVRNN